MAFKISALAIVTALFYFSSQSRVTLGKELNRKSQPTKHGEVYRAKSQIDSLIYNLTQSRFEYLQRKDNAGRCNAKGRREAGSNR